MQISQPPVDAPTPDEQIITFSYTRNDAGGLQDAIELLMNHLALRGINADVVRGRLSRPKSDSFEDFAPYFSSAVLQKSGSQDRPGSRLSLSGEAGLSMSDKMQADPGRTISDAEAAFYSGGLRRGSGQESVAAVTGGGICIHAAGYRDIVDTPPHSESNDPDRLWCEWFDDANPALPGGPAATDSCPDPRRGPPE